MRIDTELDDTLEELLRVRHALDEVVRSMRDAMLGQPGAQSFDVVTRGARSVAWCWEHEREVLACHRDDMFCAGETVATDDPTGEAAVEADKARHDHRETVRDIRTLRIVAGRLTARFALYQQRAADEKERRATERANEPGCELCARVGEWTPPRVLSSTVKGNLDRPHRLCSWHYEFVLANGRKPTEVEDAAHKEGRPVRLKAS